MPIYTFACDNCGHVFDELIRQIDGMAHSCPSCGGGEVTKHFAPIAHAKVPGGYATPDAAPSCGPSGCPAASSCASGSCPL